MKKYTVIGAKEGGCFLCVGKNSTTKEVLVLDDDTEICPGQTHQTQPRRSDQLNYSRRPWLFCGYLDA